MIKGGAVSKHCSILNYIRKADEELHELIQDLCVARAFAPRRGVPGITFLRPDKALLKEIKKMAEGDNPEEAVDAIQALILLDYLPSPSDFKSKKSDIPTFHRKKLPVTEVTDSNKIILSNGSEIIIDKDFNARSDRGNLAVYIISKALAPVDGEDADFSNAKIVKEKKGGAELVGDGLTRNGLFNNIMKGMYDGNKQQDYAMELIVSLYTWAKDTQKTDIELLIASQVSHDSLASLAIILQPYKKSGHIYISDDELKQFSNTMYTTDGFKDSPLYTFNTEAADIYNKLCEGSMSEYDKDFEPALSYIQDISAVESMVPANIVTKMSKAITKGSTVLPGQLRQKLSNQEIYAEAELRIISAVTLDNSEGFPYIDELENIYTNCNLSEPYYLNNKSLMYSSHISWFMSTGLLVMLSGAYAYVPCNKGESTLSAVIEASKFINISLAVKNITKSRREESTKKIKNLYEQFNKHSKNQS